MIGITGVATILSVLLASLIAGRISRPLSDLSRSAWQLAYVDPTEQTMPPDRDEISQLTKVFNIMSVRLSGQIKDLETERATLETVLQKMTDGVLIIDAQGTIQLVNPAAEKLFSISASTSIGKPIIEAVHHHQPVEMWQRCRETGESQSMDFEVRNRISLQGIATPLSPAIPGGTLLLFQDLSRQRRIEVMRRDFISNVWA
jgi:two-component system phosphate regulon sensor histidine kinase PhoR